MCVCFHSLGGCTKSNPGPQPSHDPCLFIQSLPRLFKLPPFLFFSHSFFPHILHNSPYSDPVFVYNRIPMLKKKKKPMRCVTMASHSTLNITYTSHSDSVHL